MGQGIKQASKKAQLQSKIDSLSTLGTSKESLNTQLSVIENIAASFIERVQKNIEDADMVVSGKIEDISLQAENGVVNIYAQPYLVYQDRGVSGTEVKYDTPHAYTDKMPPVDALKDYIKQKNIQSTNEHKYEGTPAKSKESSFKSVSDEDEIESTAYAIAKSIQKKGLKPKKVYSKEIPKLVDDLQDALRTFAIEQVAQMIDLPGDSKKVIVKM